MRLITNAAGQVEQSTSYTPFGDPTTATLQASTPEEHSFIGERFDASMERLYLNTPNYDSSLPPQVLMVDGGAGMSLPKALHLPCRHGVAHAFFRREKPPEGRKGDRIAVRG